MAISMCDVRKVALEFMGFGYRERNYYELPVKFGTHPSHFEHGGMKFKVLTQEEAKRTSKTKARRPHRILAWCWECRKWIFAGKYAQHCRMVGHGLKEENYGVVDRESFEEEGRAVVPPKVN